MYCLPLLRPIYKRRKVLMHSSKSVCGFRHLSLSKNGHLFLYPEVPPFYSYIQPVLFIQQMLICLSNLLSSLYFFLPFLPNTTPAWCVCFYVALEMTAVRSPNSRGIYPLRRRFVARKSHISPVALILDVPFPYLCHLYTVAGSLSHGISIIQKRLRNTFMNRFIAKIRPLTNSFSIWHTLIGIFAPNFQNC